MTPEEIVIYQENIKNILKIPFEELKESFEAIRVFQSLHNNTTNTDEQRKELYSIMLDCATKLYDKFKNNGVDFEHISKRGTNVVYGYWGPMRGHIYPLLTLHHMVFKKQYTAHGEFRTFENTKSNYKFMFEKYKDETISIPELSKVINEIPKEKIEEIFNELTANGEFEQLGHVIDIQLYRESLLEINNYLTEFPDCGYKDLRCLEDMDYKTCVVLSVWKKYMCEIPIYYGKSARNI